MIESTKEWSLAVLAGDLQAALAEVVPDTRGKVRKGAKIPLTLTFAKVKRKGELLVSEARHGARAHAMPATGKWPGPCQLVGVVLWKLLEKYPPEAEIELALTQANLTIRYGRSSVTIPRLDPPGQKTIAQRKLKPDPRHAGPVVQPPDPTQKRVALNDTWAFSARVPMEEHLKPKKI